MHRLVSSPLVAAFVLFAACMKPAPAGETGPQGPAGPRGADGAMGVPGTNGTNGADGQGAIVTPEPPSTNCINGGVKIQVGTAAASYACDGAPQKYYVFIRGHLASPTMSVNKAAHDQLVAAVRSTATAAGDERHLPFVGVQDPRNFLNVDVWNNLAGLQAFLSDPQAQAAFGQLFDAPPSISVMVAPAGYVTWGTLGPRPNTFVLSVRGRLARSAAGNQAAHNQVASGGQAVASSLGDYVHTAFLQRDALDTFQGVDHWETVSGMNTFLNNPDVQAAFGSLFSTAPAIEVYQTTDFAQY